jgi:hypothetical protein
VPLHASVFSRKSLESWYPAFSLIACRKRIAAVRDELSRLGSFLAGLGQFDIWKAAEVHVAAPTIHSETVAPFLCAAGGDQQSLATAVLVNAKLG